MHDSVDFFDNGSVKIIQLLGDIRNSMDDIRSIFWVYAYPIHMIIPGEYSEERKLFGMPYPIALEFCHERNIDCLWISTLNVLDESIIKPNPFDNKKYDVLRFLDKKSAMMFKLARE